MTSEELQKRLKSVACRTAFLCESLSSKKISKIIEEQLLQPAFSATANYRAAYKDRSEKTFKAKVSIVFEEIDETLFWLEEINELELIYTEKMMSN